MVLEDVVWSSLAVGLLAFILFAFLALYIYVALVLQTIAKKTKTKNSWMAWLPVFNLYLMVKSAKLPGWYFFGFFLFLIPFAGAFLAAAFGIYVWWKISEQRNHPGWFSLLFLVPILGFVMMGVIAWAKGTQKAPVKKVSSVKKAPVKKPVTKKSPVKKTATKKSNTKKVSANKSKSKGTIKKVTKRTGVKKVIKKQK